MLELLATSSSTHFYSGCIVAEVRNFRGFFHSPNHCERTYLLLHPTQEVREGVRVRVNAYTYVMMRVLE